MKRKEMLIVAVLGGCFGALATMGVGLFVPMGVVAQSYNQDAAFGTITCRRIEVVDWNSGDVTCSIYGDEHGGRIEVMGGKGGRATMGIMKDGGSVFVHGKRGELASMSIMKDSGLVQVKGKAGEGQVGIVVNEYGGSVGVLGKGGSGGAIMGIKANGNGTIGTIDKNGNPRRVR